jgi:lipopolysaccharide/colanic/teichoic acid biosynthesis glycosyltransferase
MKRKVDLALAILSLIISLPVMAVIGGVVMLDGSAPFYGHERIGLHGRRFRCLKFRTMRNNGDAILEELLASDPAAREEWERHQKLENDPRITFLGKFLRRASLDEIPQLINVICGDMSLVEPRPVTAHELERYSRHAEKYLAMRPGLTGVWQVYGRGRVGYA